MKRHPELDNRDHDFSAYLLARGWTTTRKEGNENQFYSAGGELIASAVYDNRECQYVVFAK